MSQEVLSTLLQKGNSSPNSHCIECTLPAASCLQPKLMTTFQTLDRTLALRCKIARENGATITVNFETPEGWNRATGMVRSVHRLKDHPLKPRWEITIVEPK